MEEDQSSTCQYLEPTSDPGDPEPSCPTCRVILHWLQGKPVPCDEYGDAVLGTFKEILSSRCPHHGDLIEQLKTECVKAASDPDDIHAAGDEYINPTEDMKVYLTGSQLDRAGRIAVSILKSGSASRQWDILLLKRHDVADHCGVGRSFDTDWVDLDLVKSWKSHCLSTHGEKCENPFKIPAVKPAWLIDTAAKCLVPGDKASSYVCLSYRWGGSVGFKTTTKDLPRLLEVGSLDSPEVVEALPPIVRNAMYIVENIGERYLWLDTLCIVQDDTGMMEQQLILMGSIYAGAVLTIVAGDGDSQTGLPGLKGLSVPRKLERCIFPFCNGESLLLANYWIDNYSDYGKTYKERAWTFQEYFMSRRRIFMTREDVRWECSSGTRLEFTEVDIFPPGRHANLLQGFADYDTLVDLLRDYNRRDLTYQEDALSAISGLLTVFSRCFPGGFLFGLPEMCFDMALTWRPDLNDIERRKPSSRTEAQSLPCHLPSWSWLGWKGWFSCGHEDGLREVRNAYQRGEETIPITEWYTSDAPSGKPKRRINSWWFEERKRRLDTSQPLPDGWRPVETDWRPKARDDSWRVYPIKPDEYWQHAYSHESHPELLFWLPPVFVDINESTPTHVPPQTPYIMAKTQRTWLYGKAYPGGRAYEDHEVQLMDASGVRVGRLHLQQEKDSLLFPQESATGTAIELAAICRRRRPLHWRSWGDSHEERSPDLGYFLDDVEVYDVMWIEWCEGIAYRRSIGVVERTQWERQKLEDIELILG